MPKASQPRARCTTWRGRSTPPILPPAAPPRGATLFERQLPCYYTSAPRKQMVAAMPRASGGIINAVEPAACAIKNAALLPRKADTAHIMRANMRIVRRASVACALQAGLYAYACTRYPHVAGSPCRRPAINHYIAAWHGNIINEA